MANKRRHRRIKRRLRVNFGERDLSRSGFTGDLSAGGVFIISNTLEPLDARLHLQILLDSQNVAYFEGTVAWHKNVPPELRSTEPRGFGVRFSPPGEVFTRLLEKLDGALIIRYRDVGALRRAYAAELKMGGVFIPTARPFARDSKVKLAVHLEFADLVIELQATVLQVNDGTLSGVKGVALALDDPRPLHEAARPYLAAGAS